ncbi:hypothetical protein IFT84_01890 [Rhizobium sp. CFBP 8762]|nr:hypothetical protein [Rhizobium sp. CFBP 8762]
MLTGCMGGGLDIAESFKVDRTVKTGSLPKDQSTDNVSDQVTVRNAVTSADLSMVGKQPIPWANTTSGSAGVINAVTEKRDPDGTVCRDFSTTRHSYGGIANFNGQTCLLPNGEWHMLSFAPQG